MTVQVVNHDIRSNDGGTIYMPEYIGGEAGWGNLAMPDPYVVTAVQRYPRGTMFRKGNKSWVHTKLATANRTGGIYGSTGYGSLTAGLGLFSNGVLSSSLTIVTATKGAKTLTISSPSLGTANAYAGGLLSMYESGKLLAILGIVSHTDTVITLDGELPSTYTAQANSNAYLIPSPYTSVVLPGTAGAGAAFDYCPGIFNSPVDEDGNDTAADDFAWIQTWGLCSLWSSGSYEGANGGERKVVMMGDGAAQTCILTGSRDLTNHQVIGHLFVSTGTGSFGASSSGGNTGFMKHIVNLNIRQ